MPDAFPILFAAAAALLLWAALHDVIARTIPDCVSLGLAALGLAAQALAGGAERLLAAVAAAATVGLIGALVWLRGWLGGGDVKLFAAIATLVPPAEVPVALAAAMLAGGPLALLYAATAGRVPVPAGRPRSLLARALRAEAWRLSRGGPLPYAVAIAAGTLAVLATAEGAP